MQESGTIYHERAARIPLKGNAGLDAALARVLFVGEDNPQSRLDCHALWDVPAKGRHDAAGLRLRRDILQVTPEVYRACWRTNLSLGGDWEAAFARLRRREIVSAKAPWRTIVCLGRKVCTLMGVDMPGISHEPVQLMNLAPGDPGDLHHTTVLVGLPHPSGRNLYYNSAANRRDALETIKRHTAQAIPWGLTHG
jgi:hypothetical protein